MEAILKVENLTKVFTRKGQPDFTAVDHIGFELYPGECLGLIGESGSGKTTVVNMITRLTDATEGSIVLYGDDILRRHRGQHRALRRRHSPNERHGAAQGLPEDADGLPDADGLL